MKNPEGMSIKLCNKWKETALTYHMIKKSWRNSFKKKFLISKDKLVKISTKIKQKFLSKLKSLKDYQKTL